MARSLLFHVDADSFFASVILRRRPELVHLPVAAIAHVFVASANYPARAQGVRGGMMLQEAQRLCPRLIMIDAPRAEIEEVSDSLFDLFSECSSAVEPGSMEEAFLDAGTDDWSAAISSAQRLRARVKTELGIPVSVGIARTKLMAKLASRAAKPDGLHAMRPDEESRLRQTLPLADVWGIGGTTLERLRLIGAATLNDLDGISPDELQRVCGPHMARRLRRIREGTDDAVLKTVEGRTSLSSEGTISGYNRRDHTAAELLHACITRVCRRAERAGLAATGLTVTLRRGSEGGAQALKHRMPVATSDARAWLAAMAGPLENIPSGGLIGLRATLTGLVPPDRVQQTLF